LRGAAPALRWPTPSDTLKYERGTLIDVSMMDGDEVLDANTFVTSLDDALVAVLERMEGTTLQ
jgi:hypothetical protein